MACKDLAKNGECVNEYGCCLPWLEWSYGPEHNGKYPERPEEFCEGKEVTAMDDTQNGAQAETPEPKPTEPQAETAEAPTPAA